MSKKMAYLAGLFDGEGSLSIQVMIRKSSSGRKNVNFSPRASMTLTYGNGVLNELVDTFGGKIYTYSNGQNRWSVGSVDSLKYVTKKLLPYLRIKKNVAYNFLEALNTFPQVRNNHRAGSRTWTPEMTKKVANIALTLNPASSRKSDKNISYLNEIAKVYDEA